MSESTLDWESAFRKPVGDIVADLAAAGGSCAKAVFHSGRRPLAAVIVVTGPDTDAYLSAIDDAQTHIAWQRFAEANAQSVKKCRFCGCSDTNACMTPDGPCSWIEQDVCSNCCSKVEAAGSGGDRGHE